MRALTEIIYNTLADTGLIHDEGPDIGRSGLARMYRATARKQGIYMEYAKKLIEKGEAYYCFCDPGALKQLKERQ